jgi:hypothetical protein
VSDRTPGRARLSAGCRPIGSRDRTKAAPESYLPHDLPGLSFDFCVTNPLRAGDGFEVAQPDPPQWPPRRQPSARGPHLDISQSWRRSAPAPGRSVPTPRPSQLPMRTRAVRNSMSARNYGYAAIRKCLLALLLSGWTHVFWLSGSHTIGTTSGWLERDAKLRDGQLAHP